MPTHKPRLHLVLSRRSDRALRHRAQLRGEKRTTLATSILEATMGTVEELIATRQRERSTEAQVISEATVRAHDLVTEIGRNLELAAAGRAGPGAGGGTPAGARPGSGPPPPAHHG